MKKVLLATVISLLLCSVSAQNNDRHTKHTHGNQHPADTRGQHPNQKVFLNFLSTHGETFIVYVDGFPFNPQPRHQVSSIDVEPGQHDICVRLVRPADRVATLSMQFVHRQNNFSVSYDSRSEKLSVIPEQGYGITPPAPPTPPTPPTPPVPPTPPTPPSQIVITHATEAAVGDIVQLMNDSPFDKDKLLLGKTFVKQHQVLTSQAIRMAKTITFEESRLEFLLYAFDYCADQQNYYQAVEALTFSSSRNKLLEAINR
jgi:hypothetical protein